MVNDIVSIIMPSFNTAKYIGKSIESIQNQSYGKWELIIVDDCSNDDSDNIIKKYLSDKRIRYFRNRMNLGAALCRNKAIKVAKGKYIAFCDSDDLWLPDKLEKQINFMKKNRYAFTYTNYLEINEDGTEKGIIVTGPKCIGKLRMHLFNYIGCLTVIYDADVVGCIQIPDLKKRNDWALWLKAIKKANCYLLPEVLSAYRVRDSGSITHVKGGKISLLKWHYRMFIKTENMSPVGALFWTIINLPAGYLKRIVYTKQR